MSSLDVFCEICVSMLVNVGHEFKIEALMLEIKNWW